ncbi:MAG: nucleotidyltransferase domain-containing protein [Thermoproteota archaeon]
MGARKETSEHIRQVAMNVATKLRAKKKIVGIFLFGSSVSGGSDEESDVDIGLVYEDHRIREGREERIIDGIRVDICHYPLQRLSKIFDGEDSRGDRDTWFNSSLWLGLMRGCYIVEDPLGLLQRWKEAALMWSWREDEIEPLKRIYLKNLTAANLFIGERKVLESLIFLREALIAAVYVRLMKRNLIPYWDPRFLYRSLISTREVSDLANLYTRLNDLDFIDAKLLRSLLKRLRFYIEEEGKKHSGVTTHFHNALDGYWRRQYAIGLLSARLSAFLLALRIISGSREKVLPLGEIILDGGQHIKIIEKLKESANGFHKFYQKLLLIDRWSIKMLRESFDALCKIEY